MRGSLTPALSTSISEIGGEEFFDPTLAINVQASISANAMTPSVARDFVQDVVTRRTAFIATVKQTLSGLKELGVTNSNLQPGSADLAFLIPRDLFENQVGALAKELTFIGRLVGDFSEAVTGTLEPAELEQLSSSIPTVAILADAGVIAAIAKVVNMFLQAWEKIERIRKIRAELSEMGMKGKLVEELTTQITTTINEVIEESTETTLSVYPGNSDRKNELHTAIKQGTRRLYGQIERGLTIQFRVEPSANAEEIDQIAFQTVDQINRELRFPVIEEEPLLLSTGQILEGDLADSVTLLKKTTTKKTTVKKEEAAPSEKGKK